MSGVKLRDAGMSQVYENNKYWFKRALDELFWMRHRREPEFTFEQLTPILETLIGSALPNPALAGTITMHAVKRGIFIPLNKRQPSVDPERHANKVEVYKWGK